MTAPSRTNAPAKLVTIFDSELVELSQFVATQSGRASAAVESYLRWFLLDNLRGIPKSRSVAGCVPLKVNWSLHSLCPADVSFSATNTACRRFQQFLC